MKGMRLVIYNSERGFLGIKYFRYFGSYFRYFKWVLYVLDKVW